MNKIISEALLISIDYDESQNHGILIVGRRRHGGRIEIVNTFCGNEALELYKKLVSAKEDNNEAST